MRALVEAPKGELRADGKDSKEKRERRNERKERALKPEGKSSLAMVAISRAYI